MQAAKSKLADLQLALKKCTSTLINAEPVILLLSISVGFEMTAKPLFMYWARCVEIIHSTKGYDVQNASAMTTTLTRSTPLFKKTSRRLGFPYN
ncbi:hypothetical protein Aduo_015050 [Ancylostoma duodenale]